MFQSNINNRIPFSDKPIRQAGHVEYLNLDTLETKLGTHLVEKIETEGSLRLNQLSIPESITGSLLSNQLKTQLSNLLEKSRNDLAICKINDQVGHGVFAINSIPRDTVLCFYSGTLMAGHQVRRDDHALGYYGMNLMFTTEHHRGIASFFQHLPSPLKVPDVKQLRQLLAITGQDISEHDLKLEDELYSIAFKDNRMKDNLAMENIRKEYVVFRGCPVVLFVTNKVIQPGEQLGFNYGFGYWLSRGTVPELFDNTGAIIPAVNYTRTFGKISIDGFQYIGDFTDIIHQLKHGKDQITLTNREGVSKTANASLIVDELLRVHAIPVSDCPGFATRLVENTMFHHPALPRLVKKYNLPDASQASLEKGLRNAANNNHTDDVRLLLNHVTNVNAKDSNPTTNRTALHWAALKGHMDCCNLLIASGADSMLLDSLGETAQMHMDRYQLSCARY